MPLNTDRLLLVPHAPWHLLARVESPEAYRQSFGLPAAQCLRDFFVSGDVSPDYLAALQQATAADAWTHGFALVHAQEQLVIGVASFKGPPADEVVEIAYGVVPTYENRGFATEAARALVEFATRSGQVKLIRAHTLPEPNASTRVLTKCGFTFIGEVFDPEDGAVWRWERQT